MLVSYISKGKWKVGRILSVKLMEQEVFQVERATLFKEQKENNVKLEHWGLHNKSFDSVK